MNLKKTFGLNVKNYRYEIKMSQATLAEKAEASNVYISEIERGMHSPDFTFIERISKALNVEPYQLFQKPKHKEFPKRIDMLDDYKK